MTCGDVPLLDALTAPKVVALIGASATPGRLTARPLAFLRQHGFKGRIVPVNPGHPTVMGLPALASVTEIPQPVDHAYILLDRQPALEALEQCARAGVRVVSMLAGGFAESGPEGRQRQDRAAGIARDAGMLLIGPNSTGVVDTHSGFACTTNAAFATEHLLRGRLAVLSQSGSLIGAVLSRGQARGIGYSVLVSVGNEAVTGVGELGSLLLDHAATDGFLLVIETLRDRAGLERFAREAHRSGKSVCAFVIGRSAEGQALAASHTGAITGSARALAAFLGDIGVRLVDSFDALIDVPAALTMCRPAADRPRCVTVVSTTGGGGAMLVDRLGDHSVEVAGCSPAARASIEGAGIPAGQGKLVDVTMAGTRYDAMKHVVTTLMHDSGTGLLAVAVGSSAQFNPELAVQPIVDACREAQPGAAPVVVVPIPHAPQALELLAQGGVPSFRSVESCAEGITMLLHPLDPVERPAAGTLPDATLAAVAAAGPGLLDEVASSGIIATLGIRAPAQLVVRRGDEIPATLPFPYPVVAKLVSPDLPHKSDAGAVRVGLADRASLLRAVDDMHAAVRAHEPHARLAGVLIAEMRHGLGEMLVGLTRDPVAGPIVTVGMGGILAELYRDTSVRSAPVTEATARAMLDEVRGAAIFRGYRGRPQGDLDAVARVVHRLSQLAACPLVLEAEINPLLVCGQGEGVLMLDALVRRAAGIPTP